MSNLEKEGRKDVIYSHQVFYLQWCYMYILVDGDLLKRIANLGGGHRGYG